MNIVSPKWSLVPVPGPIKYIYISLFKQALFDSGENPYTDIGYAPWILFFLGSKSQRWFNVSALHINAICSYRAITSISPSPLFEERYIRLLKYQFQFFTFRAPNYLEANKATHSASESDWFIHDKHHLVLHVHKGLIHLLQSNDGYLDFLGLKNKICLMLLAVQSRWCTIRRSIRVLPSCRMQQIPLNSVGHSSEKECIGLCCKWSLISENCGV